MANMASRVGAAVDSAKDKFNLEKRFADMPGSGGGFDRKELRELRKKSREFDGKISPKEQDRLKYLQEVNRAKLKRAGKIAAVAAATVATAGAAPAIGQGVSGIGGALKGAAPKALDALNKARKAKKALDAAQTIGDAITPPEDVESGDFGQADVYGKNGMRVLKRKRK